MSNYTDDEIKAVANQVAKEIATCGATFSYHQVLYFEQNGGGLPYLCNNPRTAFTQLSSQYNPRGEWEIDFITLTPLQRDTIEIAVGLAFGVRKQKWAAIKSKEVGSFVPPDYARTFRESPFFNTNDLPLTLPLDRLDAAVRQIQDFVGRCFNQQQVSRF